MFIIFFQSYIIFYFKIKIKFNNIFYFILIIYFLFSNLNFQPDPKIS